MVAKIGRRVSIDTLTPTVTSTNQGSFAWPATYMHRSNLDPATLRSLEMDVSVLADPLKVTCGCFRKHRSAENTVKFSHTRDNWK